MCAADKKLTLEEYQERVCETDQMSDAGSLEFPLLGLFGETGSLLSQVKKKHRDPISYKGYEDSVLEELGDVLWYFTALAGRADLELPSIARNVARSEEGVSGGEGGSSTFAALQSRPKKGHDRPTPAFEKTLMKLAGEVGRLVGDYEAGKVTGHGQEFATRLAGLLNMLIQASDEAGVTLDSAATRNVSKTFDRWPTTKEYPPLFDDEYPEFERIPRQMTVDIFEREAGGKRFVIQRCNGINMGDRITDNIMSPDDYRFHDVFHYAYAAVLGWSPVIRALYRVKRKSKPEVDRAEDGARAVLIEEGVATWIFGQAKELEFFEGIQPGQLSFDILKMVRQFVSGYEAESCPLWLWEEAILEGYRAFRFLREHRRGRLHVDLDNRRMTVASLPE